MMNDLRDRITETIAAEDVVLFMKGTPDRVLCGNSARALEALRAVGAPVAAVDVLPDPRIREELSAVSRWPTIPQVFVRGELVGGADIVDELAATGELRGKLDAALGEGWSSEAREERVIDLAARPNRFPVVP
jgi:monothiol glutaredoxin